MYGSKKAVFPSIIVAKPKSNWDYPPKPQTLAVRPPPGCTECTFVPQNPEHRMDNPSIQQYKYRNFQ